VASRGEARAHVAGDVLVEKLADEGDTRRVGRVVGIVGAEFRLRDEPDRAELERVVGIHDPAGAEHRSSAELLPGLWGCGVVVHDSTVGPAGETKLGTNEESAKNDLRTLVR